LLYPVFEDKKEEESQAPSDPKAKGAKKEEKKAPAKAPAKGGAKGASAEVAAYESPLPLTTAGIESVVLMVDQLFESLPIEALHVFQDIPVVSRDFNLHLHLSRLKRSGHKAELHNNSGLAKEDLSYIIDIPAKEELREVSTTFVETELPKMLPGSSWKGVLNHKDHIPS
jgi:hypothetical protein